MLLFIHFVSIAKYSYKTYSKNRNTRSKMCTFNFSRSCQILMAIAKMALKQLHSNALRGERAHFPGPHLLRYSLSLLNFVQSNQWTVASHWCLYLRSPHFYWGWTSLQCWLVISRGFFFSFFFFLLGLTLLPLLSFVFFFHWLVWTLQLLQLWPFFCYMRGRYFL